MEIIAFESYEEQRQDITQRGRTIPLKVVGVYELLKEKTLNCCDYYDNMFKLEENLLEEEDASFQEANKSIR